MLKARRANESAYENIEVSLAPAADSETVCAEQRHGHALMQRGVARAACRQTAEVNAFRGTCNGPGMSLLPCGPDAFVCPGGLPLQRVLNILYSQSEVTSDALMAVGNSSRAWLQSHATWGANPKVAIVPTGHVHILVMDHDMDVWPLTDASWDRVTRAFNESLDAGVPVVVPAVFADIVGDVKHAVVVVFHCVREVVYIVDSNGTTEAEDGMTTHALIEKHLPVFVAELRSRGLITMLRFRVKFELTTDFACGPQCGLENDVIVKNGSCFAWSLLFLYALTHWDEPEEYPLGSPHWQRRLAKRLVGTEQPTNVQYYAVLLRFMTQLISRAQLQQDGERNLYDRATGVTFSPEGKYAPGPVSEAAFLAWFDTVACVARWQTCDGAQDAAVCLQVVIPEEWRGALRTVVCPLYLFTPTCRQLVMRRVNHWQMCAGAVPKCVYEQVKCFPTRGHGLTSIHFVLMNARAEAVALVQCAEPNTLTVHVLPTDPIHQKALVAVVVAYVCGVAKAPERISANGSNVERDVIAGAMECVRASRDRTYVEMADGSWNLGRKRARPQ